MHVALVGPFDGPSLSAAFEFEDQVPPGYPGAPLMTTLAKVLFERGHQLTLISTCTRTPPAEMAPFRLYRGRGIRVYFCPQRKHSFRPSGWRLGRAVDFFRFERECLVAAIADAAPDVVHAHWTYEFAWAALDSGIPTLATAHDSPRRVLRHMPDRYRLVRYWMARHVIGRCAHLTAVSQDLERDLRGWAPHPIAIVSNPIEAEVFDGPRCTIEAFHGKTLVTVLNGWIELKNGATALRAFQIARQSDPGLRLVCFGAGYEPDGAAFRWAKARSLTQNVDFRGAAPHRSVIDQLRVSFALLHPSRLESFGMSVAEAMSVGLPAIAGAVTSPIPWLLDDGRAGVLVDVEDAAAVAREIVSLSLDASRWQRLSEAARARAVGLFAADRIARQYEALYRELGRQGLPAAPANARRDCPGIR